VVEFSYTAAGQTHPTRDITCVQ